MINRYRNNNNNNNNNNNSLNGPGLGLWLVVSRHPKNVLLKLKQTPVDSLQHQLACWAITRLGDTQHMQEATAFYRIFAV